MFGKVLIISATSGNGHLRAAQALEKAFLLNNAAREVRHVDALEYCSPLVRGIYSKTYIDMVNRAPAVLGWLYDSSDMPWKAERRRLAFDRLNALPLVRYINQYRPDLIITTHFMPAEIVSWLMCKRRIDTTHAIVVTDFDAHSMWLTRHYERYFTALDETKEHLVKLGAARDRVSVTGIPIDPQFAAPVDKASCRAELGLSPDKLIMILSAGGFGVGKTEEIIASLTQMRHPAQVLAMCGKNEKLVKRLRDLYGTTGGAVDVVPVAYTTEMDKYMTAADMIVGKPGGLTTSEALAKELVFVIVNPIPGQEERNSDHLLEERAAIRCNNLPVLAYKIDKLLDDPERFLEMKRNAARLGRPNAASAIVRLLLADQAADRGEPSEILGTDHSCLSPIARLMATTGLTTEHTELDIATDRGLLRL